MLLPQIDELLNRYFSAFDNTVDKSKLKIAALLRAFKAALIYHSEKFIEVALTQIENIKETTTKVIDTVHTTYDTVTNTYIPVVKDQVLKTIDTAHTAIRATVVPSVTYIKGKVDSATTYVTTTYPTLTTSAVQYGTASVDFLKYVKSELMLKAETYFELTKKWLLWSAHTTEAKARLGVSIVQGTLNKTLTFAQERLDAQIATGLQVTQTLLVTAQPYVHKAVTISQPYVIQAVQYYESTSYGAYSLTYLQPLLTRALTIKDTLEKSPTTAPYVDLIAKSGVLAIEHVKSYCLEESVPLLTAPTATN